MKELARSASPEQNQTQSGPPQFLVDAVDATNVGDYDRAIDLLKQGLGEDSFTACKGIGDIYLFRGESAKAKTWFEKARDCKLESVSALAGIERALDEIDREDKAAKKYNPQAGVRMSTYNSHLARFKNVNKGKAGMLLIPAPSFLDRWKEKPGIPEYDDCIKCTVNRMINLNPTVAHAAEYYFFGSWFNSDEVWRSQILEFIRTSTADKFASAYENGWSHRDIDRGNIYPEQCAELGVNPFECNDKYWASDLSKHNLLGHSIVFPSLQFLLYTGVTTLYVVGADCGYTLENQHVTQGDPYLMGIWSGFKQFVQNDSVYRHVRIVSINPVSLKGLFEDRFID